MNAFQTVITPAKPRILGERPTKMVARDVNVHYGDKHAIRNLSIDIPDRAVSAFIGPSGCGKSTFLRCINRMNDTIPSCRVTGKIVIDNQDIYDKTLDVVQLRARVGMVFQKPNPFPSRSSRMSHTVRESMASQETRRISRRSSSTA